MVDTKGERTRQTILESAGKLFANYGVDGVKVRTIASTAGVNVAAINYYFGSKSELYFEAAKLVCSESKGDLGDDFPELIDAAETREELIALLQHLIREKVNGFLDIKRSAEPWKQRLTLRLFLDDGEELHRTIDDFRPEHEAKLTLFSRLNPDLDQTALHLTVFSMVGQLAFYVFAKSVVSNLLEVNDFDESLAERLCILVYQNLQVPLRLPELGEA